MKTKLLIASFALLGSMSLSAYNYEVQISAGKNFADSNAVVDDSNAFGIRLNKYINENNAIMFGYTRLNDVDYNVATGEIVGIKGSRGCAPANPCVKPKCTPLNPCHKPSTTQPVNGHSGSSSQPTNGSNLNSNDNTQPTNGSNLNSNDNTQPTNGSNLNGNNDVQPHAPIEPTGDDLFPSDNVNNQEEVQSATYASTDIDRFYINGLHHIDTKYSRLNPYVYAGFGYERVEDKYTSLDSQGFFDAGLGLKYALSDSISVLADVQGVKKFDDHDLDILASIGFGYFFGGVTQTPPETKVMPISAKPKEVTIVKVAPAVIATNPTVKALPSGEYYIQMATAFTTDIEKDCKYIDELKKAGIDYEIKYRTIKGKNAQVLVVGPYATKEEAKENLPAIKKIAKDAFIKKMRD